MSNVPLPEPDEDLQGKEIAPGTYERGYRKDQLRSYAAAVSAAKDAEIAQLRAELIKSLADNAPLREQVRVLEDARPEPDCRTCASSCSMDGRAVCILPRKHCANGDRYEPLPPVRIWRKV